MRRFFCLFRLMVISTLWSCQKQETSEENTISEEKEHVLKINFKENVLKVDPNNSSTRSEEVLSQLIFEKLIADNSESRDLPEFIKGWSFDSLTNSVTLTISEDASFHNGKTINAQLIYNVLQDLLSAQPEGVDDIFYCIKGYPLTQWYRENLNRYDYMPEGIEVIDSLRLKFKLRRSVAQFYANWNQFDQLYINDSVSGTGPYMLKDIDDDIQITLERNQEYSDYEGVFDRVQLTFLKSDSSVLQNFLKGNIDIYEFDLTAITSSYAKTYLQSQVNLEYPEHGLYASPRFKIQFIDIQYVKDSIYLDSLITQIEPIILKAATDSMQQQPIIQYRQSINKSETEVYSRSGRPTDILDALVASRRDENLDKTIIAITSIYPYYYLTRKDLTGLKDYLPLHTVIEKAKLINPVTY